ncbi:L,D-transpeptidase [Rhizobium sp. RU20A]|uniref:L,D-transpeptidase family protein n=1 Tax=Rhizobium sp. RU20A TaxID=1907412 RepID=UPI00122CAAD2|nr:L,D-transpeptidase [Rhizobium sp. RU20A]
MLLTAASLLALGAGGAGAQSATGNMLLVTPDGEILDYVPEGPDIQVQRDRRGRTVFVDNWGNVIATVMPNRQVRQPDIYDEGGRRYGYAQRDPYYGPEATDAYGAPIYGEPSYREPGAVTGSVPRYREPAPVAVEREPLPAYDADTAALGGGAPTDDSSTDFSDPSGSGAVIEQTQPGRTLSFPPAAAITKKSSFEITALQVFLDREGFSPGVIDGKMGSNVTKAIEAFQQATGETLDPNNTEAILERLRLNGGMPITSYTITAADAAGPYVASIPEDYAHKAALPALSFTSTSEMLAERFHMDEAFLKELNPGVDFTVPGTTIKVISPGANRTGKVAKILADKGRKQVLAYDAEDRLIAAYPASIGSADTPSPSGTVTVERIAFNPGYTYNPKINFKQGNNDKVLAIPPGPNGPVGTVWIALSKPTYGIHGTPEPSKIGKTQSHGCIRLTNWDATELGKMVSPGVTVEFID